MSTPFAALCEIGPRDGFQFEQTHIPTALKVEAVSALVEAGLSRIQLTSFVHPVRVPQMADAEDLVAAFRDTDGVVMSGLALNERGVTRAAAAGLTHVDLSIATNEQHGKDNANMTVEEGVANASTMIRMAREAGMQTQLGLQTVWGYRAPGDTDPDAIRRLAARFAREELESFSLADSTGLANPVSIREMIRLVRAECDHPLVLHLHDTRGLGIANILAALEEGVNRFDTSLGGMGGCPFIPGATGNVASEDVIWALEQQGVQTGVDASKVAHVSRRVAGHVGHP
ncbi:MAG: hydroxymethylglutaryl-CoA lyase, partial [Bacteroidetes bacterium]|nr:hydroxymethylglutaryl-CoA lyase [Bacteroidota bacterium]